VLFPFSTLDLSLTTQRAIDNNSRAFGLQMIYKTLIADSHLVFIATFTWTPSQLRLIQNAFDKFSNVLKFVSPLSFAQRTALLLFVPCLNARGAEYLIAIYTFLRFKN
jgi:hypothetical protein